MKKGDKVVCVDDNTYSNNADGFLVKGKIYVIDYEASDSFFYFKERPGVSFSINRFISLKELRKKKLNEIKKKCKLYWVLY